MNLTLDDLKGLWLQGRQEAPHRASEIKCDKCGRYSHFANWKKKSFQPTSGMHIRKYECPSCGGENKFKRGVIWT